MIKKIFKNRKSDETFVEDIISEGILNLKINYKDYQKRSAIVPYGDKKYRKIERLLPQINERASKQKLPFEISIHEEGLKNGEVKFKYL